MQHFIGLKVKAPSATAFLERNIGLPGQFMSACAVPRIPRTLDDSNLRIANGLNRVERVILGLGDIDDQLVTNRQQRPNRLQEWIPKFDPVADKRKSADKSGRGRVVLHRRSKYKISADWGSVYSGF